MDIYCCVCLKNSVLGPIGHGELIMDLILIVLILKEAPLHQYDRGGSDIIGVIGCVRIYIYQIRDVANILGSISQLQEEKSCIGADWEIQFLQAC